MDFDLLVIGAGSGGLAAAKRAARHGAKVAIIEGNRVGGTCVIRGCVPKKLLVYGSEYKETLQNAESYGWDIKNNGCNSQVLLANVRKEVDRLNQIYIKSLESAGIELITGWASFVDAHTIKIGERCVSASNILIAVGGAPTRLNIPGGELGWVSDDLFEAEQLPESILIIGAGYIACEFACILAGLGVKVTQIVRKHRLLKEFDTELVKAIETEMQELGIKLEFGCSPNSIQKQGNNYYVNCTRNNSDSTASEQLSFNAMALLQAAGRGAFIKNLQLEAAAITHEKDRIIVNEYQQTNVAHIYAVGDVTNRVNLTPVAIDEGRAVADNVFAGIKRVVNHEIIATAVFTQPEFACVGLSEDEATNRFGIENIVIYKAKFRSLQQALPAAGPRCILKLVVAKTSNQILGCHMVGNHAADVFQMAAIAVGMGATKADFDRTMALHPSISEEFVTMV